MTDANIAKAMLITFFIFGIIILCTLVAIWDRKLTTRMKMEGTERYIQYFWFHDTTYYRKLYYARIYQTPKGKKYDFSIDITSQLNKGDFVVSELNQYVYKEYLMDQEKKEREQKEQIIIENNLKQIKNEVGN